ncbi:hypothetical protein DN524_34805, partial [Burkholderia multivorans]
MRGFTVAHELLVGFGGAIGEFFGFSRFDLGEATPRLRHRSTGGQSAAGFSCSSTQPPAMAAEYARNIAPRVWRPFDRCGPLTVDEHGLLEQTCATKFSDEELEAVSPR